MDPKEINKTSFCNKSVDNIISNDLKKYIIDDMKLRTSLTPSSRYAKIFNVDYMKNFKNPHIFCLKSYGAPYLLYFTKINNVNYTLLIDKKVKSGHNYPKMFIIQYRFHEDLYTGSLFETELVRDNSNNWCLLIADMYYYKGKIMKNMCITERVSMLHDMMKNEYNDDEYCNICPIIIKKYFDICNKNIAIEEFIPSLNYKTRGLYFIPMNINYSNVLYMFSDEELKYNFKVKKNNKNILNFKVIKTMKPEVYELYLNGKDTIVKIDHAYIPNIKCSKYLHDLFNCEEDKDITMECEYNKDFDKWKPLKLTNDRINHVSDLDLV